MTVPMRGNNLPWYAAHYSYERDTFLQIQICIRFRKLMLGLYHHQPAPGPVTIKQTRENGPARRNSV